MPTSGVSSAARFGHDAPTSPTVRAARRFLIALGLVAPLAGAAPGRASALDVGPKSLPLTVAGVAVEIPVAGSLDVHTTATAIALKATATGDLQSIQDHALAIARGLRLPRDKCKHKGLNVVDSIDEATITRPTARRRLAYSSAPAAFPTNSSVWRVRASTANRRRPTTTIWRR